MSSNSSRIRPSSPPGSELDEKSSNKKPRKSPPDNLLNTENGFSDFTSQGLRQEDIEMEEDSSTVIQTINNGKLDSSENPIKVNTSNMFSQSDFSTNNPINHYNDKHSGPFKVFIERKKTEEESNNNSKLPSLSPFEISKIIIPIFGNDSIQVIDRAGYGKIKVIFYNVAHANKILLQKEILDSHKLKAYIPNSLTTKQIIVKGVPVDITDEELKHRTQIYCPSFFVDKQVPIVNARRFLRKNNDNKYNDNLLVLFSISLTYR